MGKHERIENEADRLGGKVKEGVGKVTDDERLEAEGRGQQAGAELKQAGEKAKDAVKNVFDR